MLTTLVVKINKIMAFKIKKFYGSPLHGSSPDRPFTTKDTKRKEDKLIKTGKQLEGEMSDRKRNRKENKLLKTADQLERNASGDKTPFLQHGPPHPKGPKKPVQKWSKEKCDAKRKELKKVLAKDPYAEFGSILKDQIAKHC